MRASSRICRRGHALPIALVLVCAAALAQDRPDLSRKIETRTGHPLGPVPRLDTWSLPRGVVLTDGLSEDEAVATALWNSAALNAQLASLGFARADLIEAGLLRNPILSLLFPLGPKQLEFTLTWPLEVLWQRPRRVAAARLNLQAVAEGLVQNGLDLARDVRVAFADTELAADRARLAGEGLSIRTRLADLAGARLAAGDISALEAGVVRTDADRAAEEAARLQSQVGVAREQLRLLLAVPETGPSFEISPTAAAAPAEPPAEPALVKQALAGRPDVRAAELAVEAAARRAGWERTRVLSISGILDANGAGKEGFEAGPGLLAEIPIFNRNAGGIARTEAEIERAALTYLALRQRIAGEVATARLRLLTARESLRLFDGRLLTDTEASVQRAERAYRAGEASYILVLDQLRVLVDARTRRAEAAAEARRAGAELDRSTGGRIAATQP